MRRSEQASYKNQLRNHNDDILNACGGYNTMLADKKKLKNSSVVCKGKKGKLKDFIPIVSAEDDKLIEEMNKKATSMDKEEVAKELKSSKVEGPKGVIKNDNDGVGWMFGRVVFSTEFLVLNGSQGWIKTFSEMIKLFDRMDMIKIHSLVMKIFETTHPEGIDLILWGDLRTMFESRKMMNSGRIKKSGSF
ncbi:hypothetical protein Tco_1449912 [Tanacetum coccineum]